MKTLKINWIIVLATVLAVLCCMSMVSCGTSEITEPRPSEQVKRVARFIGEDDYKQVLMVDTIYKPGDTIRVGTRRYALILR